MSEKIFIFNFNFNIPGKLQLQVTEYKYLNEYIEIHLVVRYSIVAGFEIV